MYGYFANLYSELEISPLHYIFHMYGESPPPWSWHVDTSISYSSGGRCKCRPGGVEGISLPDTSLASASTARPKVHNRASHHP